MAIDIDSFIRSVETLDEQELLDEIEQLREQYGKIGRELIKRLDALQVKRRWEDQRDPESSGDLPPLGRRPSLAEMLQQPERTEAEDAGSEAGPRGTEAVRRIMADGSVRGIREIYAALKERGWINPDALHPVKATETAINRLYKAGELERVSRGKYRYALSLDTSPGRAEP